MKAGSDITVLIISIGEFRYNESSSSRAWHISRELNSSGINTIIVTRQATSDSITGRNIIALKPLLTGGFTGNLLFLLQVSNAVLRMLFGARTNVVIARGYALAPLFFLLRLWHKHIIYDFHGYAYKEQIVEGRRARSRITRPLDWLALKLANHILAIREELRQDLPPYFQKKTLLLPNGVDLEAFAAPESDDALAKYDVPRDKKLVGFIGNWEAWIAIEDILRSSKYFGDKIQLIIIGAGKRFEEYKDAYPSIIFTGVVPHQDAVSLIKKMDVCLCPYSSHLIAKNKSYRKVLEYLAAGKPIVASNAEGREKFLKEGENVLLYEVGDPQVLTEKVTAIVNDEKLYARMSCNNLELAKGFSWGKVINQSGLIKILQSQL
ncbi:glycosyltransferase [Chloroflexota bacterium]